MRRSLLALCTVLAFSSLLIGCEDESTSDTTTTLEPPTLELVSPADGACVAIGSDPNAHVPFVLKTSYLYLRSPGVCGDAAQCGHLELWVNDEIVARFTSNVVEWDLANVADRYGDFQIRIVAVTDAGESIVDADGEPLVVTRTITTAESCPNNP